MNHDPATQPQEHIRRRLWDWAVVTLVLAGIVAIVSRTYADNDLWGHLTYGLDTLKNGAILRSDPYSYLTAGYPWINHEWLAEISFALAWTGFGATGLVLLKTLGWTLTYAIPFGYLRHTGLPPLRAGILVLLSLPLAAPLFYTVRPHVYTALLFALLLWILLQAERERYGWLWLAPLMFALWPNLHGAFPAGLGVLGLWGLIHLLGHRNRKTWLKVIPALILSAVAILANPYGVELPRFILQHLGDSRPEITEWRPLRVNSLLGIVYLGWLGLIALGLIYTRRSRRPALLLPLAITAFLPLISERMIIFFALAAITLAGEHIGDAWERVMPARTPSRPSLWIILAAVAAGVLLLAWRLPAFGGIPIRQPEDYPAQAIALLQQSGVRGGMAVHFDWGTYAIWHLSPEIKVSLDTRREMAYPDDIYRMNIRHMTGHGDWTELIEDHPTDLVLVKRYEPADNLMRQRPDWVLVYQDNTAGLFARQGSPQAEALLGAARDFQPAPHPAWFP